MDYDVSEGHGLEDSSVHGILCAQLTERGQARLGQIEEAAEKVGEFYRLVSELQGLLARAEEGLNTQGVVGTEVEMIKQQLQEFKVGQPPFHMEMSALNVCVGVWFKVAVIAFYDEDIWRKKKKKFPLPQGCFLGFFCLSLKHTEVCDVSELQKVRVTLNKFRAQGRFVSNLSLQSCLWRT